MGNTVRERLEKMMKYSVPTGNGPKIFEPKREPISEEERPITPSKVMVQKLERAIKIIEDYNAKMLKDSECYLSLFYDRKKAEKDFLGLLQEAKDKGISIPSPFMKRVEAIKAKIKDTPI